MSPQEILLTEEDLIILAHSAGDQSEFCKIDKHPWANQWICIHTALSHLTFIPPHMWPHHAAFVHKQDTCRIFLCFDSVSTYVDKQIVFKWHLSAHIKWAQQSYRSHNCAYCFVFKGYFWFGLWWENICIQKKIDCCPDCSSQSADLYRLNTEVWRIITKRTSSRASLLCRVSIKRLLCERDGKQQQMYCLFKSSKLPANDHH